MILKSRPTKKIKALLSGTALLPALGEWVYSTTPVTYTDQTGNTAAENTNWDSGASGDTDYTRAVNNLERNVRSARWVSLPVTWFGSDLRLGECTLQPKGDKFQFFAPDWQGATIDLDAELGAWNINNGIRAAYKNYNLTQSTVSLNAIDAGRATTRLWYRWSASRVERINISAKIMFFSDTSAQNLISEHQIRRYSAWYSEPRSRSGVYSHQPVQVPPYTRLIRIRFLQGPPAHFSNNPANRDLKIFVERSTPEITVDSGSNAPSTYKAGGVSRQHLGIPSVIWDSRTEYNPVHVQWINGRNGATVSTEYDTAVDPDPTIGQPYVNPGTFANQSAGIVLVNYTGGTNQEAYSPWNHADTSTGGPGGNIPAGWYRYRTYVWSPVARYFMPAVRKGGVGHDWLLEPAPRWVAAKTWTELVLDFSTDDTFGYVEIVLDKNNTDTAWFYTTNTSMFQLDAPKVAYKGTPADQSVLECIEDLRARGKKVMFYPSILLDVTKEQALPDPDGSNPQGAYPWRGRIRPMHNEQGTAVVTGQMNNFFGTCSVTDFTPNFTDKTVDYTGPAEWGLRRFILHYAHLCAMAGGVDAFCIATELPGVTSARDGSHSFPAIAKLKQLAADVRGILGNSCEITYACDWSELMPRNYMTADGFNSIFHLDPLWSDPNIDFVGIDNFIPLSDWRGVSTGIDDAAWESIYELGYLKSQIEGGEFYDYMYLNEADRDNQIRTPIQEWRYRAKDHKSWWANLHYDIIDGDQSGSATAYVPKLKRIVYTAFGCATVDKGSNQPSKFLDPKSVDGGLPYYSTGQRDDRIQKVYYQAMTEYWEPRAGNNPMSPSTGQYCVDTEMQFAWAWDARPWPAFPNFLNVWPDGENYSTGHWLQGRQWIETT